MNFYSVAFERFGIICLVWYARFGMFGLVCLFGRFCNVLFSRFGMFGFVYLFGRFGLIGLVW